MAVVQSAAIGRRSGKPEEPSADLPSVQDIQSPEDNPNLPATSHQNAPALRPINFDRSSGVEGDWDESDISVPCLRLARGSGESTADFTEGSVILGEELVLDPPNLKTPNPDHTLRFIPYRMNKRWRETITDEEQKSGVRARIVDTKEEVYALGGSIYKDEGSTQWKRCVDLYLLVEAPKGCLVPDFALDLDDKSYANVIYYARGTDFYGMAKDIFQTLNTVLNVPVLDSDTGEAKLDEKGRPIRQARLYKHVWTMRVIKRQAGAHLVYTPKVTLTRDVPGPEALAYIQNLLDA